VDLVDEEERPPALGLAQADGLGHDLLDLLDAGGDRRERHEVGRGLGRDEPGQRGLARPRRTPEDERRHPVRGDGPAEEAAFAEHLPMPHHLGERPGPHALGQRIGRAGTRGLLLSGSGLGLLVVEKGAWHGGNRL
jgi:hypothetical protein